MSNSYACKLHASRNVLLNWAKVRLFDRVGVEKMYARAFYLSHFNRTEQVLFCRPDGTDK